jgi:hypothetical protein
MSLRNAIIANVLGSEVNDNAKQLEKGYTHSVYLKITGEKEVLGQIEKTVEVKKCKSKVAVSAGTHLMEASSYKADQFSKPVYTIYSVISPKDLEKTLKGSAS